MEKKSGIYQIRNLINGKLYIGQSIDLAKRKTGHFCLLKRNKHTNCHLQNAYNKYEKKDFVFEVLIYCEHFELTRYEQFFVDKYKDFKLLYNICIECVETAKGIHPSPEEIKKKSGKNNSMWGRRGKKSPNYGRKHTDEARKKISEGNKGKKRNFTPSPEQIEKKRMQGYIKKEIVIKILEMSCENKSISSISEKLGIGRNTVRKARNGFYNDIYNLDKTKYVINNPKGKNNSWIVSKEIVLCIRKKLNDSISMSEISRTLNVGVSTVIKVRDGFYNDIYNLKKETYHRYRGKGENNSMFGRSGKNSPNIISKDIILKIVEMLDDKAKIKDIIDETGISDDTIYKVKKGFYDKIYNLK